MTDAMIQSDTPASHRIRDTTTCFRSHVLMVAKWDMASVPSRFESSAHNVLAGRSSEEDVRDICALTAVLQLAFARR